MNYIEHLNLFGIEAKEIPCIKGSGAPTKSTKGAVGLLYMNTDNGDVYKCTAVNGSSYTWASMGSGGNVDLTGVVKSVNGVTPDENGNVVINVSGGGASISIGSEQPTDGTMYWLDTSEDEIAVVLTGISAVYSGGNVTVGTAVTDLTGIVVTAQYSDGSAATVTGYTLSGTIAEGNNTVTVTYQNMTATFTVTGVAEPSEPEVVTYTIINSLTNVTNSNAATSVEENASYTATLTAADGYELDTVTVTMGGTDVTSTVYANGVVNISAVTGNVVITANATAMESDSGIDFSETNVFASKTNASDGNHNITVPYSDFLALNVQKLYYYELPKNEYQRKIELSCFPAADGFSTIKLVNLTVIEAVGSGQNEIVTNGYDHYKDGGFVVFEIDIPALKAAIQAKIDDGTLNADTLNRVNFGGNTSKAAGTEYLLYNYTD